LSQRVLCYDFDDFRLEPETRRLLKEGVPVPLSAKTFQTLLILVEQSGKTVEKGEIYERLWGDSFVEEGNLTQQIYVLRKVLGQSYVETVARHGYRFTAEVKPISAELLIDDTIDSARVANGHQAYAVSESTIEAEPGSNGISHVGAIVSNGHGELRLGTRPGTAARGVGSKNATSLSGKSVIYGLLILMTFGLASYLYLSRSSTSTADAVSDSKIKSIAILPFISIGGADADDQLGLGMTVAVITRLSALKQIPVRPTSAVFRFVGTEAMPEAAGRDLQVDAVLEGTVQRGGDWVRVSVRLIRVATGKTIWAETFDGKYTHIFQIQDTISARLVDSLAPNLSPNREPNSDRRATDSVEAYQAHTLGVYFWNKRTKEALKKAEQYFSRAIELDPSYAQAYAGLADTYNMLAYNRFVPHGEVNEKAKAAAVKAIELDETVAEGHMALAHVQLAYERNNAAGLKSLERAIELSPYNASVRIRYGWVMVNEGRLEDAEREMRLGQSYDPLSPTYNLALGNVLLMARKYDEAEKFCERGLEIDRNVPGGRISLAEVSVLSGKTEKALALATEETHAHPDDLYAQGILAYVQARAGDTKSATEIADRLRTQAEKEPAIFMDLVLTNYAIGRKDIALTLLKEAMSKRAISRVNHTYDPKFDPMRVDPQFAELLKPDAQ
jgi:TolB-like protein/DNA-binding winged helix-turn-helix (wHTH) protein/Flp pilus assembly protein TadD